MKTNGESQFRRNKRTIFYSVTILTIVLWILLSKYLRINLVNLFLVIPTVSVFVAFFIPLSPIQIIVPTVILHILNVCFLSFRDPWGVYDGGVGWPWLLATIVGNTAVVGVVSWGMKNLVVGAKALWWSRMLRAIGGVLFALGLAAVLVSSLSLSASSSDDSEGIILTLLGGLMAIVMGKCLGYRGRQYDAIARREQLEKDHRPPVLYLRSFQRDESIVRLAFSSLRYLLSPIWWRPRMSVESFLADAVAPIGPLMVVGKPGERLPKPGGYRVYIADKEWKTKVVRMMKKARLVIIRLESTGEGLWWEIERASKTVAQGRLLFLIPENNRQYRMAQRHMEETTGLKLPALKTPRAFLWFKGSDTPTVLKFKAPFLRTPIFRWFEAQARCALRPVFESLGYEWIRPPISASRIAHIVFAVVVVIIIILLTIL